jgi:hypothetical protein
VSETTQRRAERMARLDRDLRRMALLHRRALLAHTGRRRVIELRRRGQAA